MIAIADALVPAAVDAGIKVPDDLDNYVKEDFPHWFIFTTLQLGQAMPRPGVHWHNAEIIAALPEDQLRTFTVSDYVNAGFEAGFPTP